MSNLVCGVIVTYHPDEELAQHIAVLRGQVGGLVVVDNRSSDSERVKLRELAQQYSFTLLENQENLGIGAALNQGVRWAAAHGVFRYVALFDQDSEVPGNFTEAMLSAYENNPRRDDIAILVPRYIDSRLKTILPASYDKQGNLKTAMTSGSFIPISIFSHQGWFEEDLFIGGVDFEYSLRIKSNNYLIEECKQVLLLHAPSSPRVHTLFGFSLFKTSNYSALRRYYSERNRVWIRRKYWKKFPTYCLGLYFSSLKEWTKILLGEVDKRVKFYYMGLGIRDGLLGRMGRNTQLERKH
jgi:rhamnosyltransferase